MQCPILEPQTVACSGHGECDTSTGKCICDAGWSSLGDFALTEGADCDINVVAVQTLWGIALVLAILSLFPAVRYFVQKYLYHKVSFENKSLYQLVQDPMFTFPFGLLLGCASLIPLAVLRIIFTEEKVIGGDFAVSILWYFSMVPVMVGGTELVKVFSGFLMSSVKVMPESVKARLKLESKVIGKILPFLAFGIVFDYVLILPIVWYPALLPVLAGVHLALFGVLDAIFCFLLNMKSFTPVISELQKHLERASEPDSVIPKENVDQMKAILLKMRIARAVVGSFSLILPITFFMFGCWPYLLRKTSYFIPIVAIAIPTCTTPIILSVTNFNSKHSSSSQDRTSKKGVIVPEGGTSNDPNLSKFSPAGTTLSSRAAVVANEGL